MERHAMILLALVATASAGPMQRVSIDTCSNTCKESGKYSYMPGTTYEYVYRSNVKTLIQGANTDEAGIMMSATVNLEVLSKCELSMRLSEVKLEEFDPKNTPTTDMSEGFAQPLEQHPLRISFQAGNIEHLCPTAEEPTWVMNVKRGIVSLIQNNMGDMINNATVTESDVSGECVTNYQLAGTNWYTTSITKTKDLLGCKGRQSYNSAIQGIPYTSDSNIQSLPIVKSELECSHEVDRQTGVLKMVTCKEQHMLRPFSSSDSGAVTTNTQELKYLKEIRGIRSPVGIYQQGVSLKFAHENPDAQEADPAKNLKRKLLEICQKTKSGVQQDTPALFTNLVYLVRSADASTLTATYDLVDGKSFCADNQQRTRKFFLDALPMAGTSSAVSLMISLITQKTVTGCEAESWISSLAFIKTPEQDMLKEVKPLINMAGYEEQAMLSVGTLIHNYCESVVGCNKNYLVTALVSAIENQMAKKCKVTPENKKVTLMALRGIGNAGYARRSVPTLEACMDSPLIDFRLSAIEAFRRMPCDVDRSKLQKVFLDADEDSEIRIAAYRNLMQCPSKQVLTVVKNALENEQVNQVGSYVWTHLTNLMETSDRHKQDIRAILEDETFKKEFDLDKRKFSRNYEGSVFLDALNTGAKVEGDLIWSSKSFVPRSSMVNLTVDLFGNSVNLFELGGRMEGLEYLLESFFGPNGYFSQKSTPTSSDVAPQAIHQDKMKKIDSRFGSKMDELRGSMYMRVFGNELKYFSFDSLQSLLTASDVNILDMMVQLAKNNDYTYTHSSMFLDSSIIIPTGSGFPLNLTVNGTSTVDLRIKGKIDLRTPPHVTIDGLIQPSATVGISTMMSVDAFVTRPGIKMVSTLHSSTAVQGKIVVQQDGSVSAEYEMPQPKMEIIDVKTSFFTIHTNVEREQQMIVDNRQTVSKCSPSELVTITGLELCAEVTYPNASQKDSAPYFPFTGPVSAGLYLYKRDTHTKYQMNVKSVHDKTKNILHFSMNTPGSRTDRHVLADVSLDKEQMTLDMTMTSPWKRANLQGTITSTKALTGLTAEMSIDGKKGYKLDAKLANDRVGNARRYTPSMELSRPNHKPISIQTMFMRNGDRQFDIQFSVKGVRDSPVTASVTVNNRPALIGLKASLELEKDKPYTIDTSLSSQATKKKMVYKPLLSVRSPTAEVIAFGGTVANTYGKKLDINLILDKIIQTVSFKGVFSTLAKRRGRTIYRNIVKFSSGPADLQLDAKIDNRNFRVIATDFDMTYVIRKIARNNIKLVSKIQNLSTNNLSKAKAAVNLAVKRNPELNMKLLGNINHNKKHTDLDLDLRYGQNFKDEDKHIDMAFESNRNYKGLMQASADIMARLKFPGQDLNIILKGDHKHNEQDLDSNIELRLGKNQPFSSSLKLWERWEAMRKVSGEFLLSYPGRQISINHTLSEASPDKFVSIIYGQTQKGQKSSVTTAIDITKTDNLRLTSDWLVNGHTPTHLEGEFQLIPNDFITRVSVEKEANKYAGSVISKTVDFKTSSLTFDFEHPSRRVILGLNGNQKGDKIYAEADLRWNADRNDADRVTVKGMLEQPTLGKFNSSLSLSYPSRTLILNAYHQQGNKYSSGVDFQWDVDRKISAESIIGINSNNIYGKGKLTTPFQPVKTVDVELSLSDDNEEYKSDITLTHNSDGSISMSTMLKKPISLHTLVASFETKNNFADIKNLRIDVDHKLSSSLASAGKLLWNRQSVQLEVVLQNTSKPGKTGVKGSVDIKTTFRQMKKATVEFSHDNNGRIFNTMAKFSQKRQAYSVESKITHTPYENKYENKGTVDISIPTRKYETSWTHSHALEAGKISTAYSTKWGKKQNSEIAMKFDALYKKDFDTNFKLETPWKSLQLTSSLTKDENVANCKFNLMEDGQVFAASTAEYSMDNKLAKAGVTLEIPRIDIDSNIQANVDKIDATASFSAVIMPDMTASLDIKSGLVLWKSTFPGYEQIRYTYEISDGKQLIATETLEYGDGKVIRLETRLQVDHAEKRVFCELTTPFEYFTRFSTGINFLGDLESFDSNGFIEMHPGFDKISAEASYNSKQAVSGKLRVDTPFESFQYFQADFNGNVGPTEQNIEVQIEYQPRKIVKLELKGNKDPSTTSMSAKLSVPEITISADHKMTKVSVHSSLALEMSGKIYGLDLDHTNAQKLDTIITVTVPSRKPIIVTISHEGDILDFKTQAEVQHNRKNNFVSYLSFKATDYLAMSTRTTLQTEIISPEEYTVAASYNGSPRRFNSHAEISSISLGKSTVDITLNTEREVSGSLVLMSPMVKNIKASFNHFNSQGFLQTRADLIRGGQKLMDVDASLKTGQSVVAELSLKTVVTEDIQGLVRFDGSKDNFALHTEGSLGGNKVEAEYISRIGAWSVQQTVTVKAPAIKDITAELSLTKSSEYKGYAEFQYGVDKHRLDVGLRNVRDIEGSFSLESPLVAPVTASFNIQGNVKNFSSQGELSLGQKRSEIQVAFQNSPSLKASMAVTSPYMKNLAVSFEHSGKLPEIVSKARLTIENDEFDAKLTLSATGKFSTMFTLTTPFKDWPLIQTSISQEGTLDNFRSSAEYTLGKYKSNMDFSMQSTGGSLTVSSHLNSNIPDISASFEQSGSMSEFRTEAQVTFGRQVHRSDIRFTNKRKLSASVDFESPVFGTLQGSLKHEWIKPQEIKCHADVKLGNEKTEADFILNWSDKTVSSVLTISCPYVEDIEVKINHNGPVKNFISKAVITKGGEQSVGEVSFNLGPNSIVSKVTAKSPYSDLVFNFRHGGELKKFTTHGDVTLYGAQSEFDINVDVIDNPEATIIVTSPDFSLKLNHNGNIANFVSSIDLINDMDVYSAKASLKIDDDILVSFTMSSPIKDYESFKGTYTHKGILKNFQCHLEVETPSQSSISDLIVNDKGATLDVSYPKMRVKFLYNIIPNQRVEAESELTVLDMSYTATVTLVNEGSALTGNIEVKSPIEGSIVKLSGSLTKPAQFTNKVFMEMVINNDHNEIEATFTSHPKIDGDLSVKTVYFPHVDLSVELSGSLQNFMASSEVHVDGERKGKIQGQFDMEDKHIAGLSIETPFTNYTSLSLDTVFKVQDPSRIDTSVIFTVEGEKIVDADIKYTHDDTIQADAHFDSVYLHPVAATFRLEKEGLSYMASSGLTHNRESLLSVQGQLNYLDKLNSAASLTIKPHYCETLDSLSMAYSMENSPENLKYHIETAINEEKMEVDVSADIKQQDAEASFNVKLPARDPVKGAFSYKNKFSKYIVKTDLELDALTKYEYNMNVKTRNGLDGKITITTPIEGMSKTTITFDHNGAVPNLKSSVSAECDNNRLSASVDLAQTADKTSATVKIALPMYDLDNVEATFYHEGDWSSLKAGSKLMYATGQVIEGNVEHMLQGTSLKSSLMFKSPFTNQITVSANHTGAWDDFSSNHALTMGPDNIIRSDTTFRTGSQYLALTSSLTIKMTGEINVHVVELKHDGNLEKFRTEAKLQSDEKIIELDTVFQLNPIIEGSVSLTTPFEPVEDCKISFSHSGGSKAFLTTGEVQYASHKKLGGRLDVLIHDLSRMDITAELSTPFEDLRSNKITYHHSGSMDNFQCETSATVASKEFSSTISGKLSPPNLSLNIRTPFEGYKTIDGKFSISKNERLGRFSSHLEGSLSSTKAIFTDITLSSTHNKLEGNVILSTPFEAVKSGSVEFSHQNLQGGLLHMLKASLNGESMIDIETNFNLLSEHKHASIITRAPVPMKYEMEGDFTLTCVDIDATANYNTAATGKVIKLECGYDFRADKTANFKLTGLGRMIDYKGQFLSKQLSSELNLNLPSAVGKYGFDITQMRNGGGVAKVMLPSRTLALSGHVKSKVAEGTFMWDADRDQTKRVELTAVLVPTQDSVKMDVTLRMPSLGKEVKVGSEVVVNRGGVIFEGKTELSYSSDERQRLLFSTKLEDVSTGQTKNYSFGVSHPYSTVGIKLASHIGKSSDKYSAGMGLEYLTARRQTKTFAVNGMINKLRKTASFELQSPVKSISIASSLKTGEEFQVTLTNTYDRQQPISTTLTISPAQKSIHFITNYDLDNPRNTFHVQMHYPSNMRVEAEVYRIVNQAHVTDALAAATLNNSRLLHTRLHWRPEALNDLKAYTDKKSQEYNSKSLAVMADMKVSVLEELAEKTEMIWDTLEREVGQETMAKIRNKLKPVMEYVAVEAQQMMTNSYNSYLMPMSDMASRAQLQYQSLSAATMLPSVPSFQYEMIMAKPSEGVRAVKQAMVAVMPTYNSSEYDTYYLDLLLSVLEKEINLALKDLADVDFDYNTIIYDPKNGEIQVEFHLPLPLTSLDAVPVISLDKYLRKMKQVVPDRSSLDVVGKMTGEWIPPFTGVATVKAGHQITTFDGYMYDLPIDCTFVLARDFLDGNFSVILSNDEDTTLTLLSDGPTVTISVSGKITIAGKELMDMPFAMKDLKIYKQSDDTVRIEVADHLSIVYDLSVDHITVNLSGWYHGKTGGLLGTYDNEPSNDLMTSFGKVNSNQARFAKTWDVGTASC